MVKLAEQLAAKPTQSIPAACGGWGDTAAAYRMLDNERCDWREIIEAHGRCAVQWMAGLAGVLCLHDTTELDFNGQTIQGLGPLSYEAQRGMYLHPTYAVSTDREPLGVLDAWMWAREPKDASGQRGGPCESTRWIESYERLGGRAADLPETRLVQVGDRESDILALMQRAAGLGWPVDLLVRSQHNRRLPNGARLWDEVQASESLGEIEFTKGSTYMADNDGDSDEARVLRPLQAAARPCRPRLASGQAPRQAQTVHWTVCVRARHTESPSARGPGKR